jgi:hypothetical protein
MSEHIDPIPINFLSLDGAVQRLANRISKHETGFLSFDRTFHGPGENGNFARPSALALHVWNQCSIACAELKDALTSGALEGLYLDRSSGQVMKFEKQDWLQAAFFQEILRGGIIRSSVGESIARADGRRVLINEEAFTNWLRTRSSRRPAVARNHCAVWLKDLMNAGPKAKMKAKYQDEAFYRFGISQSDFRQIWRACIQETGADWGHPGRPRISSTMPDAH